jgi:GTP-binding protein Era
MKSGFITIIGRSNVGKSTLINRLVGTKVAITTPKPQTTRRPIRGVLTRGDSQAVIVDTPGIMQKARDPLTQKLNKWANDALEGVDGILHVVDATRSIGDEEKKVLQMMEHVTLPTLLVINKTDEHSAKKHVDFYRDLSANYDGVVEISAIRGTNVDLIERWILDLLPEGDFMYPAEQLSDLRGEEQVEEIIREKLFLRLREELPYTTHVRVREMEERDNGTIYIAADVEAINERYQRIIIGKGGQGIKEIGQSSRKEMQAITGQNVYLDLEVTVNPHWVTQLGEE